MQKESEIWYASWFNTPYYHILYKDRDYEEAANFMRLLTNYLDLEKGSKLLDLACGKGRHSKFLNQIGYDVTGVDLSPKSIEYAKQFENPSLRFKVQDMCIPLKSRFDGIFNLFTSFGYFEDESDNVRAIQAIKTQLKANGYGVIDFLNSEYVTKNLIPKEVKIIEGITFNITREYSKKYIFKKIEFEHNNQFFSFTEKVKALTLNDFKEYFKATGVTLNKVFGSYDLTPFDTETSQRLILIFN